MSVKIVGVFPGQGNFKAWGYDLRGSRLASPTAASLCVPAGEAEHPCKELPISSHLCDDAFETQRCASFSGSKPVVLATARLPRTGVMTTYGIASSGRMLQAPLQNIEDVDPRFLAALFLR